MFALISAGQNNGSKIKNSSIYCTTYPCHNCARHLIAAGVMNIFYIEPYPKSLAVKLHSDSITENENEYQKVRLLAFDGISPNRYLQFFTYKQDDRKKFFQKGIKATKISPKIEVTLESLPILEGIIVKRLSSLREGKNDG
jgi:deoxycytidylate deaminase